MGTFNQLGQSDILSLLADCLRWAEEGRRVVEVKYESQSMRMGTRSLWCFDYDLLEGLHLTPGFDVSTLDVVLETKREVALSRERAKLETELEKIQRKLEGIG